LIHDKETAYGASRLIWRFYHEKHLFVVHINKMSAPKDLEYEILNNCCGPHQPKNIIFLSDNIVVNDGISVIQAELDCLNVALQTTYPFID
jgi:hypothetical protein